MYKFIFALLLSALSCISYKTYAQTSTTIKTDTITISGNCSQCKTRIEEAAYVKGVKKASWDKKTKLLTVTYSTSKANLNTIANAIAKAGHDSRLAIASDKDYKKIPDCCAYRNGVCHHE